MRTQTVIKLEKDGYRFSGIYGFYKDEVTKEADELRKEGYLARVVFVPSSKYARGGRDGYSVYQKPTKKREKELEAKKIAKENKRLIDLESIRQFFITRTGVELVKLFKEAKGSEADLLWWAKKETIIN